MILYIGKAHNTHPSAVEVLVAHALATVAGASSWPRTLLTIDPQSAPNTKAVTVISMCVWPMPMLRHIA